MYSQTEQTKIYHCYQSRQYKVNKLAALHISCIHLYIPYLVINKKSIKETNKIEFNQNMARTYSILNKS